MLKMKTMMTEDFPIKVKEDLPSKEDFSTKTKKKRKSELEKLKIDMKGWNYFAIVKQNSQDEDQEIPEDQKLSRSFQEALRCCREALLKMGFIYTLVKTETKVLTIQQEIPLALQAVVESTSRFNKVSQDNQNNMPKKQFVMCGHVGVDREIGDGADLGRWQMTYLTMKFLVPSLTCPLQDKFVCSSCN